MFKKLSLVLITLALMGASLFSSAAATAQAETVDKQKVEEIIRAYILDNPEIIYEAIQILQERQRMAKAGPAIEENKTYLYKEAGATESGNPKGDVTIVEFFDYRCGYCKRHHPVIKKLLVEDPNLRVIYKHYPILDYNDESKKSRTAAFGAMAADKQGKFEAYHDRMMTMSGSVTIEGINEVARSIGLDMDQFKADLRSSVFEKRVMNALYMGQALELTGTPAYVIGKNVIDGAQGYDKMKAAIARERKRQAALK